MRTHRRTPLVLGLTLASLAASGVAQTLDTGWRDVPGHNWRNRWEGGGLPTPVSAQPLELVGFVGAPKTPAFNAGEILTVFVYLDQVPRDVRLYAREIEVGKYYWMQSKPYAWTRGWNRWGPWSTSEVIAGLQIPSRNVGVVVRLDDRYPNDGALAPAILRSTAALAETVQQYEASFLPGSAYSSGEYEVRSTCGAAGAAVTRGAIGRQRAGFGFPVPFALEGRPAGQYELFVSLTRAIPLADNGRRSPAERTTVEQRYCFFHQPDAQVR